MPIHDWTRVAPGIFHAFHHEWISALAHALNHGLLPKDYYALPEQFAAGFGPDVLTLQGSNDAGDSDPSEPISGGGGTVLTAPRLQPIAETDMAYYRRKQKVVVVRHVSDDRVVAVIEIVSPSNKAARNSLRAFLEKAAQLLDAGVHLLIADLQPPGNRDPHGIHGAIWDEIDGREYVPPEDKPLTLVAYEAATVVRAYVVNIAVGDAMESMPLFLDEGQSVTIPLQATYDAAFNEMPSRWRRVLEAGPQPQ